MKTNYRLKNSIFKISAKIAGEKLTDLYEKNNNALTPKIIVNDARNQKSVLHPVIFHCNDKEAAEKYWLNRAGDLIRNLIIIVEKPGDDGKVKKLELRVFYNIRDDSNYHNPNANSRYVMIDDIMKDPNSSAYLLQQAFSDLVVFRDKYNNLKEVKSQVHIINKIIDSLKGN